LLTVVADTHIPTRSTNPLDLHCSGHGVRGSSAVARRAEEATLTAQ